MTWGMFLTLIFIFDSIKKTSEMLEDLRIYPIDLIMQFNDQIAPEDKVI